MNVFLQHASQAYALVYFGVVFVVSLLEWVVPRRQAGDAQRLRWLGNIGITVLNAVLLRSLFPIAGVAWAVFCSERGWGLFNQVKFPGWLAVVLTVVALDGVSYAQHRVLHRVPTLWRLHRTHHSDQEVDFTTGLRFHPLEAIYTTSVILSAILVLGAPPIGVLIAELLSAGISFLEHGNWRMPLPVDHILRLFLVTPDMHRIHHSQDTHEGMANLGNILPWWDHVFGTYVDQPSAGHDGMALGLVEFGERKHLTLPWMLAQPFLRIAPIAGVSAGNVKESTPLAETRV